MKETICKCDICGKVIEGFEIQSMILQTGSDPEDFKLNISSLLGKDICEDCCKYFTRTDKVRNMKLKDAFYDSSYSEEDKKNIFEQMDNLFHKQRGDRNLW